MINSVSQKRFLKWQPWIARLNSELYNCFSRETGLVDKRHHFPIYLYVQSIPILFTFNNVRRRSVSSLVSTLAYGISLTLEQHLILGLGRRDSSILQHRMFVGHPGSLQQCPWSNKGLKWLTVCPKNVFKMTTKNIFIWEGQAYMNWCQQWISLFLFLPIQWNLIITLPSLNNEGDKYIKKKLALLQNWYW